MRDKIRFIEISNLNEIYCTDYFKLSSFFKRMEKKYLNQIKTEETQQCFQEDIKNFCMELHDHGVTTKEFAIDLYDFLRKSYTIS